MQLPAQTFHENLKYLRKRLHLTQDALGLAVGYTREHIARLESGQRKLDPLTFSALFVPALALEKETRLVNALLALLPSALPKLRNAAAKSSPTSTRNRVTPSRTSSTSSHPTVSVAPSATQPLQFEPLPLRLMPLIGRSNLMEQANTALGQHIRLLTVLGAPGVGKTHLALAVAQAQLASFAGRVAFFNITPAENITVVLQSVSTGLGLSVPAPVLGNWQGWADWLAAVMLGEPLLLVLDNCEQVSLLADLLERWLWRVPNLYLLCTSRSAFGIAGEFRLAVPPLSVPNLQALPELDVLALIPSVQLLLHCLRRQGDPLLLSAENALTLASLTVVTGGLPLALELLAAQCLDVQPQTLLRDLLRQRKAGQRANGWQLPLHATIQTSFDRLTPEQQGLFAALGVLHGTFTAEQVQGIYPHHPADLRALVTASLLQRTPGSESAEYSLLVAIRDFAEQRLLALGQLLSLQHAHGRYFGSVAEHIFVGIQTDAVAHWNALARLSQANFWAAFAFAIEQQDSWAALQIVGHLWWYYYRLGQLRQTFERLQLALQLPKPAQPDDEYQTLRGRALNGAGSLANELGELALARPYFEEAMALYTSTGNTAQYHTVLHNLALLEWTSGDLALAAIGLLQCANYEIAQGRLPAQEYSNLSRVYLEMNQPTVAESYARQGVLWAAAQDDGWVHDYAMVILAECCCVLGNLAEAEQLASRCLTRYGELAQSEYLYSASLLLAKIETLLGKFEAAQVHLMFALQGWQENGDELGVAMAYLHLAEWQWRSAQPLLAVRSFGLGQALRKKSGRFISPWETHDMNAFWERAVTELGQAAAEAVCTQGAALNWRSYHNG